MSLAALDQRWIPPPEAGGGYAIRSHAALPIIGCIDIIDAKLDPTLMPVEYAALPAGQTVPQHWIPADIVAVGHLHFPHDDSATQPRLVILGGWHHRASYLRIDADGARLIVEPR